MKRAVTILILLLVPPLLSAIAGPILGWTNSTQATLDLSYNNPLAVLILVIIWALDYGAFIFFLVKWFRGQVLPSL
jgi:hypothetical protein